MPICVERIAADIAAIARCTPAAGAGSDRPTFSPAWRQARDHCIAEAERAGCHWRIDAAGNVHIRPTAVEWSRRAWLSGSHIDSVPLGGDFDGVVGVVAALEVLRAAHEDGRSDLPFEAIVFAEEEGTTFGLGMLGSRGWAGTLDAAALGGLRNRDGLTWWQAGADYGADPGRLASERLVAADYAGFVEVHIEQGPAMWKHDRRVALVTAIVDGKIMPSGVAVVISVAARLARSPAAASCRAETSASETTVVSRSVPPVVGPVRLL